MAATPISAARRTWRITTAVRVFAVAVAVGRIVSSGQLNETIAPLVGIVLIATASAVLDLKTSPPVARWMLLLETLAAATWICVAVTSTEHLLIYLVAPPIIGGVRYGWVMAANASLLSAVAFTVTSTLVAEPLLSTRLAGGFLWITLGLGGGLLSSVQARSLRTLEERHAAYAAAHELVSQLHSLARRGSVGLDSVQLAADLDAALHAATGATRSAVYLQGHRVEAELLWSRGGDGAPMDSGAADIRADPTITLPLNGDARPVGKVVLVREEPWSDALVARAQEIADEYVLPLDTAVLFDDVRLMATAEERNRIAREMHDGVAQEIVALGYVVDEIETVSKEPDIRALAAALRDEISRVVTELRFSIFDLRHQVTEHRLPAALTEYVREVSHGTDLRVHLVLDESGPALAMWIESELLRVAQEAIGNVRKHARAQNLWLTLVSDGVDVTLRIEDDGVGNACPRDGHWGLQSMTERAERIGAHLTIAPRPEGGTIVLLSSTAASPLERKSRDHHSAPR